jgi:hypothetical protein
LKAKPDRELVAYFEVPLACAYYGAIACGVGKKIIHGGAVSAVLNRFDSFITSDNDLNLKKSCCIP